MDAGKNAARPSGSNGPQPEPKRDDGSAETAADQARWSYAGTSERGRVLHFSGHVTYLGGAEGERLQGELSTAILDLLRWATTARYAAEVSSEHEEDTAV
jgi:hypothetical protein